jgi:hypothetical protein
MIITHSWYEVILMENGGSGRPGFDRERRICRVAAKGHRYEYEAEQRHCARAKPTSDG